jgi:hypothetical protein
MSRTSGIALQTLMLLIFTSSMLFFALAVGHADEQSRYGLFAYPAGADYEYLGEFASEQACRAATPEKANTTFNCLEIPGPPPQ